MTGPRIGSLCSGYGGLDMGLMAVVGGSVAWHVEYDKAPSKILAHHRPDVPNYGDITTTDWTQVEPVDWLTAGYPCQPFSHAGKRKGTTDERHIWPFVAGAISVLRPRRVLLENVRGHLTLGFDSVLADLARLGYDATWGLVRAADAGAPHSRARLFVVATDASGECDTLQPGIDGGQPAVVRAVAGAGAGDSSGRPAEGVPFVGRGARPVAAAPDACGERHGRGQDSRDVGRLDGGDEGKAREWERSRAVAGDRSTTTPADADDERRDRGGLHGSGQRWWPESADGGSPTAADADLAGSQVPQPEGRPELPDGCAPADTGRLRGEPRRVPASRQDQVAGADGSPLGRSRTSAAADTDGSGGEALGGRPGTGDARRLQSVERCGTAWGAYEPAIRRWEAVTGRPAPAPTEPGRTGQRLAPRFVEWMQGLPAGHVTDIDIPRNAQLKALGNGVVPQQAALALRALLPLSEVAA